MTAITTSRQTASWWAAMMIDGLEWMRESIAWDRAHRVRYHLRRTWYWLTHPMTAYRKAIYWPVRTFIERGRRGWSVQDTWSLDTYLARVMAESLAYLRVHAHGYPANITAEGWDAILTEMEGGFRRWTEHFDDSDEEEAYRQVQASIQLMHEWFANLWD